MSLSSYTFLSKTDYDNLVYQMLKDFEGPQPYVYVDSTYNATIGIGFEISAHPRAILEGMGYSAQSLGPRTFNDLASALTTAGSACYLSTAGAQEAINQAVNSVLGTNYGSGGGNFGYGNNTGGSGQTAGDQMQATFNLIEGTYEKRLDGWLLDVQNPTTTQKNAALAQLPYSTERAALLSLTYNNIIGFKGNGSVKSPTLRNAIVTGDRAEAWYQIRYYSNGNNLPGIARRRYEESQIFGLFSNPANPSLAETVQAYQMLTAHRAQIAAYDNAYGYKIPTTYGLAGQTYGNVTISHVQTLIEALQPAEAVLMTALDTEYGSLLSGFAPSNSKDIYLNPGRPNALASVSSSYSADLNASASSANDLLIASTGSTRRLTRGQGGQAINCVTHMVRHENTRRQGPLGQEQRLVGSTGRRAIDIWGKVRSVARRTASPNQSCHGVYGPFVRSVRAGRLCPTHASIRPHPHPRSVRGVSGRSW